MDNRVHGSTTVTIQIGKGQLPARSSATAGVRYLPVTLETRRQARPAAIQDSHAWVGPGKKKAGGNERKPLTGHNVKM
ncbi:hypothetical protein N7530_003178 [Penicillium desertorum]|uniref:Uncharacterized protein n=1 Tax=Penicillium desertorum TaxID=1303715 RepID=A0A9W9WVU4_9EURO|nr:hypothetical protein N7530_003178 [Penicillium desertorum]